VTGLLARVVVARGRSPARRLREARQAPVRVQQETLRRILAGNAGCDFGKDHGFARIRTPADYRAAVPVREYEALLPYVERMLAGSARVLCEEAPFMFGTTSGTTSQRKFIPINGSWARTLSSAMRLWLARSTLRHPELWQGKVLTLVGSTLEGRAPCGLPHGSVSGLTGARVARAVKQRYALPTSVAEIVDHETRYEVAARLMLESDVSLAAAPNATTLLRLASVGAARSEAILRGIFEGKLGVLPRQAEDVAVLDGLEAQCRPNPLRARELELAARTAGVLRPREAWPRLALIGCWLGGTAGSFARRLREHYGDAPLRDLGLRATEATMTLPLEDEVASGVPLLHDNYYEFLPESAPRGADARALGIGELEVGERYFILLTTPAGLYRYDISDVVEVTGKYHELPLIEFVHKGPDMLNMTGEKLHARQVAVAIAAASDTLGLRLDRAQLVPDVANLRYDLLIETPRATPLAELAAAVDTELRRLNPEYELKRASGRLGAPRAVRMKPGWGARLEAADIARGSRAAQYKWPFVRQRWDDVSQRDIDE
jgi:GH3 auxin-responsive promoter